MGCSWVGERGVEGEGGVMGGGGAHEPPMPMSLRRRRATRNWNRVMKRGAWKLLRTSLFRKVSERDTTK